MSPIVNISYPILSLHSIVSLSICSFLSFFYFFFFNDTATTEIYTLSLHDALPILRIMRPVNLRPARAVCVKSTNPAQDRKSTRLNSSHTVISYAVFCLKKKKKKKKKHNRKKQIETTQIHKTKEKIKH